MALAAGVGVDGQAVDPALAPVMGEDRDGDELALLADADRALQSAFMLAAEGFGRVPTLGPGSQTGACPERQDLVIFSWSKLLNGIMFQVIKK